MPSVGRKKKELTEEQYNWLTEFLLKPDMTYTNPGRKDMVYTGKVNGQSVYKTKHYLLWSLNDALRIVNEDVDGNYKDKFGEKLPFSLFYRFIKREKQFYYNNKIPHSSCLCDVCENASLLAQGIARKGVDGVVPTNPHEIVEKFSCDSSNNECMSGECHDCNVSRIEIPLSSKFCSDSDRNSHSDSESDSDSPCSSTANVSRVTYQNWQTIDDRISKVKLHLPFIEAVDLFREHVDRLKQHIYTKRVQHREYKEQKCNLGKNSLLVHVDFAESYKNTQQNAIQSAYFGAECFSIFTAVGYSKDEDNALVHDNVIVVSEVSDHSRIGSLTCLDKVVAEIEAKRGKKFDEIIVWSDGCTAQFRSRYIFFMLTRMFPGKYLRWFYNEAHHGKGPMDGIGGTVKHAIFKKVKSGLILINSPEEFANATAKFLPSITTVFLSEGDVMVEPEGTAQAKWIDGTQKVHMLERRIMNGIAGIDFFFDAAQDGPFHTQWYPNEDGLLQCGHDVAGINENHCGSCRGKWKGLEDWLQCQVCQAWFHESCLK